MLDTLIMAPTADELLLDTCRAVETNCLSMLDAARQEDWERVARLQAVNDSLIANMRAAGDATPTPAQRREQLGILRRIVIIDGEIRRLREPWQRGLDRLLAAGRRPVAPGRTART
jgi:hypothetical protein